MFSEFISATPPSAPTSSSIDFRPGDLPSKAIAARASAAGSGSIDQREWRRVIAEDEYHRTFVELNSAFYADYQRVLNDDSWAGLSRFLKRTNMCVRPTVGAESNGRVIATWRIGDEALSLEFVDKFKLKFAVTVNVDGALHRRWGLGHAVALFEAEPLTARFSA